MVSPVADKDVDVWLVEDRVVNVVEPAPGRRDDIRTNVHGVEVPIAKRVQNRRGLSGANPDVQRAIAMAHVQIWNRGEQDLIETLGTVIALEFAVRHQGSFRAIAHDGGHPAMDVFEEIDEP